MEGKDPADIFRELAEVCRAVTPVLSGNAALIREIDGAAAALAPRLAQAIEALRKAIQAQTQLLNETATRLRADAGDAVTALEAVPAPAQAAGASIDGLQSALQKGAQAVAEARAAYSQVVSAGVEALYAALEGYHEEAQGAADDLGAEREATLKVLQDAADTLDDARDERFAKDEAWADAIDALADATVEPPQTLAVALAKGADEVAKALVEDINAAIDKYHDLVDPAGPVHPRFMVKEGDPVATARDALTESLEKLGEQIAQDQVQVSEQEMALVERFDEVAPALTAPQQDLRAVGNLED